MTNDKFQSAESEFLRLKGQLAAGRLTPAQFDAALRELIVEDAQGKFWMLGADSGKWYVHDGQSWVEATPPSVLAPNQVLPVPTSQATSRTTVPPAPPPQPTAHKSRRLIIIGGGLRCHAQVRR